MRTQNYTEENILFLTKSKKKIFYYLNNHLLRLIRLSVELVIPK